MEPLNNRVWFAGEAAHETLWGRPSASAWESGGAAGRRGDAGRLWAARMIRPIPHRLVRGGKEQRLGALHEARRAGD